MPMSVEEAKKKSEHNIEERKREKILDYLQSNPKQCFTKDELEEKLNIQLSGVSMVKQEFLRKISWSDVDKPGEERSTRYYYYEVPKGNIVVLSAILAIIFSLIYHVVVNVGV